MADEQPQKKSKLKWILLIFLLLIIGAGVAVYLMMPSLFNFSGSEGVKTEVVEKVSGTGSSGIIVPIGTFSNNLADPLGRRFIKISLEAEVASAAVGESLAKQYNGRIRESVLLLLSSKAYADLASTESKIRLKSELTDRLNGILGPGRVHQVFITDIIIQ